MKISAGLFSLFLVCACRNLQVTWVLMSGIVASPEWMFLPVIASFLVSGSVTETDFSF